MSLPDIPPREAKILELIASGLSTRDIAKQLGTSRKTVGNQITMLYIRLGVNSRVQATLRYLDQKETVA